jgi:HK97 family phage prohead protease
MADKAPKETGAMEVKDFRLEFKELDETGAFTGIASVYGVEDLGGDVIEPNAFNKTLAEKPTVKILWQHDPREVIGEGAVSDNGREIIVKGRLDMDDPVAQKVYGKLKRKLVDALSIGFQTVKAIYEETPKGMVRHITELKLWEISIVTFPMLPQAAVLDVKDTSGDGYLEAFSSLLLTFKAGRKISKDRAARLRAIADEIQALLAEAGATDEDQEDTTSEEAATKGSEPEDFHSIASVLDSIRTDWASAA